MPNKLISDLPANTTPTGSVKLEIDNGGTSQQATLTNLLASTVAAYQSADTVASNRLSTIETNYAQLVSPAFTGTPTAPTAASGTNTTQLATTAFSTTADLLRLRISGADTMLGPLNMGTNKITNLTDGTVAQDAVSLIQMQTADALKSSYLRAYDPTVTSAFPTTWGGTALALGHRFYITVAGTVAGGGVSLQVGDVIEASLAPFADNASDWVVFQGNAIQATTTVMGIGETATNAEAVSKASTTVFLTPSNLATGNYQASATFEGLVELATQAEVTAGTDTTRAVTPATLAGYFPGASLTQYASVALDTDTTLTAGTSQPILKITSTSTTTTSANRVITLVPSSSATTNNSFKIITDYGKVGAGFTWKIKYSSTDLVSLTEGTFLPTVYDCYWNGSTYIVTESTNIFNNNTNSDFFSQQRMYSAEWSFAQHGGGISTIVLPTQFPDGAIVQRNGIIIETVEALTSGGAATVSWGYTGVTAGFDAVRNFNAVPYTTINLADSGAPASTIPIKLVGNQSVTMTIAGAALTAGYIRIYLPVIINKI